MTDQELIKKNNILSSEFSRYLVEHPERVYSRQELMERVWDVPESSLDRTVDTHIKTIRSKLKSIDPDHDPIVTHRGLGYSLKVIP